MWRTLALLVASLCFGACGRVAPSDGAPSGSGGDNGAGARSGGTGGPTGGTGGSVSGGTVLVLPGGASGTTAEVDSPCPAEPPSLGAACSGSSRCPYDACGVTAGVIWSCSQSEWVRVRGPGCVAVACPTEAPEARAPCESPYLTDCSYEVPCCESTMTVTAMCNGGRWLIASYDVDACSPCANMVRGAACELPEGCASLTCYSESCYSSQRTATCSEGTWQVQDDCSK